MAEYEAGNSALVTKAVYGQLEQALQHCHDILGEADDR
jgi:hypothetical protein